MVLRHTTDTNNTVLSASGGHIYLRPRGTSDTTNEAIIYPDGSVNFTGAVKSGGANIIDTAVAGAKTYTDSKFNSLNTTVSSHTTQLSNMKDYITATGTASMGSNGTWYWTKWNSGKAECYGCRNFGSMKTNSSSYNGMFGNGGPLQTQTLPSGLFISRPDYISIEPVEIGGLTQEMPIQVIKVYSTPASATNTGSFALYTTGWSNAPTVSSSYIGFHVIGRWK